MRNKNQKLKLQLEQVIEFCQENDLDKVIRWIEDRMGRPVEGKSLYRVYSQNYEGSKFTSRRILANSKTEAALNHDRVYPEVIISHVERIY